LSKKLLSYHVSYTCQVREWNWSSTRVLKWGQKVFWKMVSEPSWPNKNALSWWNLETTASRAIKEGYEIHECGSYIKKLHVIFMIGCRTAFFQD
jgi:hypothetical protein